MSKALWWYIAAFVICLALTSNVMASFLVGLAATIAGAWQ